ncbi:MAG TPA: nicotinamide-nucleotide amidohydrolase family protein [Thermohalobaculum sp.]|nr:nicotinamide-nucleotide amidohydrolase family protein [Thermohalobaculum sp.]
MAGSEEIGVRAAALLALCAARRLTIATAESCTGGMVIAALTDVPGASAVVERGFVTYSNAAKTELLGVPAALVAAHGAVSEAVARAMAEGALTASPADLAVAITGIAGPGGGSPGKPEGLVHFACARRGRATRHARIAFGPLGRAAVREASVREALAMLHAAASDPEVP